MAYTLMVSRDCGTSFRADRTVDDLDDLEARTEELDEQRLRWYVEQDGMQLFSHVCAVHVGIIAAIDKIRAGTTHHKNGA